MSFASANDGDLLKVMVQARRQDIIRRNDGRCRSGRRSGRTIMWRLQSETPSNACCSEEVDRQRFGTKFSRGAHGDAASVSCPAAGERMERRGSHCSCAVGRSWEQFVVPIGCSSKAYSTKSAVRERLALTCRCPSSVVWIEYFTCSRSHPKRRTALHHAVPYASRCYTSGHFYPFLHACVAGDTEFFYTSPMEEQGKFGSGIPWRLRGGVG